MSKDRGVCDICGVTLTLFNMTTKQLFDKKYQRCSTYAIRERKKSFSNAIAAQHESNLANVLASQVQPALSNSVKYCSNCVVKNVQAAHFCESCGTKLGTRPRQPQQIYSPARYKTPPESVRYETPPEPTKHLGKIETREFKSSRDYKKWIRRHSNSVEIIDVESYKRGWNLLWGPLGSGRTLHMVTFRKIKR
jgi:hypothetical protein